MQLIRWMFHFIAYYLTWFACIIYAASGEPWMGPAVALSFICVQLLVQMISHRPWLYELLFALTLMFVGMIVDTTLLQTGWIYFKANPFADSISPPWMACLWLSFGFTVTVTSRAWLHRYIIMGVLTFISLPFAYWIGVIIGAAVVESWWFYPILGGTWMVLLPFLLHYYLYLHKQRDKQ